MARLDTAATYELNWVRCVENFYGEGFLSAGGRAATRVRVLHVDICVSDSVYCIIDTTLPIITTVSVNVPPTVSSVRTFRSGVRGVASKTCMYRTVLCSYEERFVSYCSVVT